MAAATTWVLPSAAAAGHAVNETRPLPGPAQPGKGLAVRQGRAPPVRTRQLVRRLAAAIRDNDKRKVEETVLQLARTRRILAPLAGRYPQTPRDQASAGLDAVGPAGVGGTSL